jgi:glycosyltransferase involved in cell wall biosynthesis
VTSDRATLRVTAIMDTAILSGPGRQLTEVARAVRPLGIELTVVTFQRRGRAASPFPRHLAAAGVPCEVIDETGSTDVRVIGKLRATLRRLAPHVVQTHSYRPAALVVALRTLGARWPWIAFFHGTTAEDRKVRLYNWLDRRLLQHADRVVVMSKPQLDSFRSLGSRVKLIHNAALTEAIGAGINDDIALPRPLPGPVLGIIGRLSAEKGVDVLLRAVRMLRDRDIRCSLLVAGDGPERASLTALSDELKITDAVHFLGTVHPIAALYPHLDVVVLSSHSEGLPNVLLEALAADRAVVATRVGAIPEVVHDPDAGELVVPGSPEALADGIARALGRLGDPRARAARRAAVEAFSLERRAQAHAALYDETLRAESRVA